MTYVPSMYKRAARKATEPKPLLEADGKPLPRKLSDAIVLAGSIAATLQGAPRRCQRRECRRTQRCCSADGAAKGTGCDVPLPQQATIRLMAGMFAFMHALVEKKR
ncbi:hypothetical protein C7441_104330 [Pseudaminobacter salicylatoxidans]|uniref:Uncharacterized protein n=1 Tax=Pseudaminobacter salicylatoxidans TaxID=93369 RepID=A0A316C5P9_PSESE|nr:hypothetical protein [Pseudaminobacter salicylatoxidans]PWJ85060.1 hypothetical protein C7441_104330 [Pseudaminobacter salicylatoxidans]